MSRINTPITRLLGIRTPVISGPMAGASGGALAAAVTAGGGFGFLAAGYDGAEIFKKELNTARSDLGLQSQTPLPIGVGYLAWQLEKPNSPAVELLSIALDTRVQAVWFAFGSDLGRWVEFVRGHDKRSGNSHKTLVFAQISTLEEAKKAISEWKVDVVVAQGIESGGHGHTSAPSLLTLVSSIIANSPIDGPPLLGAGGLSHGAHVASLLTLGTAGAVLGTRFLLTPESLYTDAQRQALLAAKDSSTVRTLAFDRARGTLGWPNGVDGRALFNDTVKDDDNGVSIDEVKKNFAEGVAKGDANRMLVWAGTGVSLMTEVKDAKAVVQELHQEIAERLRTSFALVVDSS